MKKIIMSGFFVGLLTVVSSISAEQNLDKIFKVEKITDRISLLRGGGGNIAVYKSSQGLVVIDDEYAKVSDALQLELKKLAQGMAIRFIVNTHWHGDHTGGNLVLGESVDIVAHENVRKRLASRQTIKQFGMTSEPQPKEALPDITFTQALSLHLDEPIELLHFANSHTDGDTVVFFPKSGVAHLGDLFFAGRFPFVDIENGGNVQALSEAIGAIIERLPADVKVIPGHGSLSNMKELKNYHQMLRSTITHVRQQKQDGKSLSSIQVTGLPDEWAWGEWGDGFIQADTWIQLIYDSL